MGKIAKPADGIAWVTGASSGLGKALTIELVKRGWRVAVSARSVDKLEALKEEVDKPDNIIIAPADVTDDEAVKAVVDGLEKDHGPIVRAVMNAGTYDPMADELFNAGGYAKLMNINTNGTANCLEPIIKHMAERKRGQIAVVASIAGYRGLPQSVAYSSSKAALIAMTEALKFDLDPLNIHIQIVNPGFVRTPLTDKNEFDMPFLMEPEDAAREFADGLDSQKFEIVFPWIFAKMVRRVARLPYSLYFKAVTKATSKD
ncbi:MAG: SDR family NAD(P)-dependent oxidoreductase [Pseudomonadota bacterium]